MSDRLLAALRDLPIEYPEVPEVRLAPTAAPRRRLVPAVAIVAAFLVVGSITPVRDAVADLLGIGVVRVIEVERLPVDLGSTLDLGVEIEMPTDLAWPAALGDPDAAFARDGELTLAWGPSARLPDVADTGVGAILTRFDGTLDPAVQKTIGEGTTLSIVTVDGRRAYWIEGAAHSIVYIGPDGEVIETSARLAGNVLIWEQDGHTFRFESSLGLDAVQALFER